MQYPLFYNSVKVDGVDDRSYDADSFSDLLKKFFTTGVFEGELQVSAVSGMGLSVSAGYANINGKVMMFEQTPLTVGTADGTYYRIDSVIIERNDTDRQFYIKIVQGTTGTESSVTGVTPVRSGVAYQLVIARIKVRPGATAITQADITDTRADANLCGYVAGTVTQMDFSQFKAQFDAYFNNFKTGQQADFDGWFANLQYVLDGDVAGHLQNEIDKKLSKSGGAINGLLSINATETTGNDGAVLVRSDSGDASGELIADRNGEFGLWDTEHGRWVCKDDADGRPHVPVNPAVLNTAKVACTTVGLSFTYTTISGLANWSVVAVHFTVYEASQVLFFVRGESHERTLTDAPNLGRFRGGVVVDWSNNRIGIRAIAAGSNNSYPNTIYFDYVYGIL